MAATNAAIPARHIPKPGAVVGDVVGGAVVGTEVGGAVVGAVVIVVGGAVVGTVVGIVVGIVVGTVVTVVGVMELVIRGFVTESRNEAGSETVLPTTS